jgi:hypothetical protein
LTVGTIPSLSQFPQTPKNLAVNLPTFLDIVAMTPAITIASGSAERAGQGNLLGKKEVNF